MTPKTISNKEMWKIYGVLNQAVGFAQACQQNGMAGVPEFLVKMDEAMKIILRPPGWENMTEADIGFTNMMQRECAEYGAE